ncbi:hypothetical protein [Streptomyces sp. NPDC001415]
MPVPLVVPSWTDHVTGRRGHLVLHRLMRGASSGCPRIRPTGRPPREAAYALAAATLPVITEGSGGTCR